MSLLTIPLLALAVPPLMQSVDSQNIEYIARNQSNLASQARRLTTMIENLEGDARKKGDLEKAIKKGYAFTQSQLNLWGLKYHKLIFGKPEYDIVIDDKSYNYNQDWIKNLE